LNKLVAAVVIVVLLGLGSIVLIFGGTLSGSMTGRSATTSLNESLVSPTRLISENTSNLFHMDMNVIPTIRLVPLGGSANYTVILYNGGNLTGSYSLSAAAPSGLAFKFGAVPVDVSRTGPHLGYVLVSSSCGMSPGTYQVRIMATGPKGVANQTFDFHVQRNLVLLSAMPSSSTSFFSNLTVKAGDSVTWVSWDGPVGDDNPDVDFHHVIFSTGNLTSGLLDQYQAWSHTFMQPGVYRYYDSINSPLPIKGEVISYPLAFIDGADGDYEVA
jgi:hypothetical protein